MQRLMSRVNRRTKKIETEIRDFPDPPKRPDFLAPMLSKSSCLECSKETSEKFPHNWLCKDHQPRLTTETCRGRDEFDAETIAGILKTEALAIAAGGLRPITWYGRKWVLEPIQDEA